ncbi:MAG: phosphoribosylformylglycinamidine cyclo-ligase [Fimbriimonadaceae bacterium]
MADQALTYRSAGVDIDQAERSLRGVLPAIQSTYNEHVLGGVGGFGGLFRASFADMERPVLVASIDGVGTKTKIAAMVGDYSGLGRDIVNHCVNDILCQGARPLFFMDYFASARLEGPIFESVLRGAAEACQENGAVLIGGETAEMPGVYLDGEIDIVGSIVGVVDQEAKLPRGKMSAGDVIIGIASNGLHTNGYSLARRALFEIGGQSVRDPVPGLESTIGEELIKPHRSYFNAVYPLVREVPGLYAIAHVTGGGIYGNLPRVMPSDIQAVIERRSWSPLPIFRLIQDAGGIADVEMFHAFNMGIGMVLFVSRDSAAGIVQRLNESGEAAAEIGYLQDGPHDVQIL